MIKPYIGQIQNIKAAEQGFKFIKKNWAANFGDTSILSNVASLDGQIINRQMIVEAFDDYFKNSQTADIRIPFLYTMIWGFGNAGYGSFRTNRYLSSEENLEWIRNAMSFIEKQEVKQAFDELLKIKGLGISFASKLLYFAGKASGLEKYPLIFDNKVACSLVILLSDDIAKMLNISPLAQWGTYNAYNTMIHKWANDYSVEADQIELFLFNQDFSKF